ncbi:hypothetical protein M427DRAFT_56445 [Gonapodya prolifera JEL478]|uniref:Uncharacterized protein n=1 Tax=Gonapodya prolifera (strain JEL478) TaxID=1344416 RepID=A0A139AGK5_GONPJ|nr:hypothetical protein M427DRAFT_56445 [Gonapodya prolifera JEL478]|eukprot:KXS15878.1 hypothetical protein M427DRAFT_56445 [Gonapodya prolifera JEL478]
MVLLFYAIAFGSRLPILRHPLRKLIVIFFVCNLIGTTFYNIVYWIPPDGFCHVSMFLALGFVFGEYSSTFNEYATLLTPFLAVIVFGSLTIGGTGAMNRDGACWFHDMLGWRALTTYNQLLKGGGLINWTVFFVFDPTARRNSISTASYVGGGGGGASTSSGSGSGRYGGRPTADYDGKESGSYCAPSRAGSLQESHGTTSVPWGWYVARAIRPVLNLIARNSV